jgi:hypothetical protein
MGFYPAGVPDKTPFFIISVTFLHVVQVLPPIWRFIKQNLSDDTNFQVLSSRRAG